MDLNKCEEIENKISSNEINESLVEDRKFTLRNLSKLMEINKLNKRKARLFRTPYKTIARAIKFAFIEKQVQHLKSTLA